MVAELATMTLDLGAGCSLAKISMVAELLLKQEKQLTGCSLAKISMVAEQVGITVLQ